MPAQHSTRPNPARVVVLLAALILVALVSWIAVRAAGPGATTPDATMIMPVPSQTTTFQPDLTPVKNPYSSSPTPSPASSPSSRKPSRSPSPSPRRSPSPSPLDAVLSVGASWNTGYVAGIRIHNAGTTAAGWSVSVSHSGLSGLRLLETWSATGHQQGDTFVFSGGPIAPGATVMVGYEAGKNDDRNHARPTGCTIVGGGCKVS